jgi:hypothetical protein
MKPPAYFGRAAGLRSPLPYLVPPRAHGRLPMPAEIASATSDAERAHASAASRGPIATAAATVVTSSGAKRTAPAKRERGTEHASAPEATPAAAASVVATVPADGPVRRLPAAPAPIEGAPDPQARPRRAAARSIVATETLVTTPRVERNATERDTVDPVVPREPSSSPQDEADPPAELRPLATVAARRTRQVTDAATQEDDEPSRPRREQAAAAREPLPPPLDLPAPRPRPAPSLSTPPRASASSGEVRIGTLEVRVLPPAAEPQPAVIIAAPAAPSAPLARGFASSIGIRQA